MTVFPDPFKKLVVRVLSVILIVAGYIYSGGMAFLFFIFLMVLVGELTAIKSIVVDDNDVLIKYYFRNELIKISEIEYIRKIRLMENSRYVIRIVFKNKDVKDFIRLFSFSKADIDKLIFAVNKKIDVSIK